MAFQEFHHDFGVISANVQGQFSIEQSLKGNASVPATARIPYATITNFTLGSITVNKGTVGQSIIGIGQTKRVDFPYGTRFFTVLPAATTTAGTLLADIGVDGVIL